MHFKWASKAFSIAELMIVIVVLAILTTIVIVSYNGFQERARDSERSSHIAQIKIALEKYYAANSQFPAVCAADNTACTAQNLTSALAPYINKVPLDPKYDESSANKYEYVRGGTSGNAYGLRVMYEIKTPCVDGVRIVSTWWSSAYPNC